MSRWKCHAFIGVMLYFVDYMDGRTEHALAVPLTLLVVAIPMLLWMWKGDTHSG